MNSDISTCILLVILGFCFFHPARTTKILAVSSHFGKSHFDVFEPYFKELAARGHQIRVISHFPRKRPIPNYKDIDLRGTHSVNNTVDVLSFPDMMKMDQISTALLLSVWVAEACEKTLQLPHVQHILNSDEKFDLLIAEMFNTDCFLAFAHKFKIPIIGLSTCVFLPWTPDRVGNPDNPAYIPTQSMASSDKMSFVERFINTFWNIFHKLHYPILMDAPAYRIAKRHFGESLPALSDLARNTSLIFVNSHFSLNRPRPLVPGVIEVAGIHIKSPKPLSKVSLRINKATIFPACLNVITNFRYLRYLDLLFRVSRGRRFCTAQMLESWFQMLFSARMYAHSPLFVLCPSGTEPAICLLPVV
jgi:glucuronosyltransferase